MTKAWFTRIKSCYPKAYYECLYRFRDFYPEHWKAHMTTSSDLIEYFRDRRLNITIESETKGQGEEARTRFRFVITGAMDCQSAFEYKKVIHAQWAALEFAFMMRNFKLRKKEKQNAKPIIPLPYNRKTRK